MDIILENFKKTGKCNLQLGKESLVNVMGSFALPKNSKYTKTVNQGLLEIIEAGLVDYWDVMLRPMPLQCLKNIGKGSNMLKLKSKKPPALTLKNLTGAFVILLLGFSLSLLAFLCEKIVSMPSRNRRRLEQAKMKFVNKSANTFQEKSAAIKIKGETISTPAPMKQ
ncbi:ionotropic receptor 93a-like [Daphnia pulex]|uniref:ionotropic receptor 93a-like n=1 Tax=Daphnia pulex TaxID=6669 RepID=UPI001EDF4B2C|nr:ionotropic receptor 93a-like [Daphnia pulex]